MPRLPVPADLRSFIARHIPSVPALEALLLLRSHPARAWAVAEISARVYVNEATVASFMTSLAASELVAASQPKADRYAYAPATPELAQAIDQLAAHYVINLLTITDLIHSRIDRRAEQFSDAFRWRKDT